MFKITEKSHGQRLLSLVLAVILLFSFMQFNVQPAAAGIAGVDVAVVALRVSGNTVTTTLRLVQGTAPESIEISYYQNGKLLTGTTSQSLKWSGQSAAVETELSGLGTTGSLTVIIGVPGDTNVSNNNRTAALGASPDQTQPPASVTGLRGSATQNTITLTWTASADADSYRVLDKNGNVTATVTGTSYTATGLSPDTSYTYYVVAVRDGASSGRASITCKTLAEVKPTEPEPTETQPTTPSMVKDVQISHSDATTESVTLTWSAVSGSTGVEPEKYTITIGGQTYNAAAAGSHTFTGLTAGQTYTYKVVASADGKTSSEATGTVTLPQPPTPVSGIKTPSINHSATAFTSVTLTWGYDSTSDGEVPAKYIITIGSQTFEADAPGTKAITGLNMGQKYTYSVKAVSGDASGTASGSVQLKSQNELVGGIDLVVTDIILNPASPAAGDAVSFSAVITNQGNTASNNVKHGVRFYVDNVSGGQNCASEGFFWSDQCQSSLASGASAIVTVKGSYLPAQNQTTWTATAGSHTVTAYVDDSENKNTGDSNTGNNYLTRSFTVARQTPVEIPTDGDASNVNLAPAGSYGDRANNSMTVLVDGVESPCFNAWVNTSRIWNQGRYETMPVTIFEMKEENRNDTVRVALGGGKTVSSVVVRPASAGIQPEIKRTDAGQTYVEFKVNKRGSYSVEFNGETSGALQVFVNPDYTNANLGGRYIPLGTMTWDAGGFGGTVYGSGVLLSSHQGAVIEPGSGARIYGITIANEYQTGYGGAGSWEVQVPDRGDIEFNYFHIIACSPNSDGISIQSSNNIRIYNSYFRTWDDGVVLKNYSGGNTHDITVKNCVFWTDLAQSMEIGAETNKSGGANAIYNAIFEDIDVIHSSHKPAMSIHNMDNVTVSNVQWKNVTIEDAQMGNNLGYGDGWPLIIDVTNVLGGEVPGTSSGWTRQWGRGTIKDVTFENISVLSWKNDVNKKPGVRIMNSEQGGTIQDIRIYNLSYNGEYVRSAAELSNDSAAIHCQFSYRNDVGHDGSFTGCRNRHAASDYVINNFTVAVR